MTEDSVKGNMNQQISSLNSHIESLTKMLAEEKIKSQCLSNKFRHSFNEFMDIHDNQIVSSSEYVTKLNDTYADTSKNLVNNLESRIQTNLADIMVILESSSKEIDPIKKEMINSFETIKSVMLFYLTFVIFEGSFK